MGVHGWSDRLFHHGCLERRGTIFPRIIYPLQPDMFTRRWWHHPGLCHSGRTRYGSQERIWSECPMGYLGQNTGDDRGDGCWGTKGIRSYRVHWSLQHRISLPAADQYGRSLWLRCRVRWLLFYRPDLLTNEHITTEFSFLPYGRGSHNSGSRLFALHCTQNRTQKIGGDRSDQFEIQAQLRRSEDHHLRSGGTEESADREGPLKGIHTWTEKSNWKTQFVIWIKKFGASLTHK